MQTVDLLGSDEPGGGDVGGVEVDVMQPASSSTSGDGSKRFMKPPADDCELAPTSAALSTCPDIARDVDYPAIDPAGAGFQTTAQ